MSTTNKKTPSTPSTTEEPITTTIKSINELKKAKKFVIPPLPANETINIKEQPNLNLRNYWYPICFSTDVQKDVTTPYAISLLGDNLVLYRDSNGKINCVADLCPHVSLLHFFFII